MNKNIITENGYSVEQSISGYWRLMKDGEGYQRPGEHL